ncbi:unnamed protein product [Camellia sinensis]
MTLIRWRVCFWVSAIPAAVLAVLMEFCAESPHWLFKRGRIAEAEIEFEKLLGGSHFKSAVSELSKSDRGDEADALKFSELFYGRHFKVCRSTFRHCKHMCRNCKFISMDDDHYSEYVVSSISISNDYLMKILIMEGTQFIGVFLSGLLVKEDFCYFEDIDWLIHSLSRYALDDIGSGSHVHLSLCQS